MKTPKKVKTPKNPKYKTGDLVSWTGGDVLECFQCVVVDVFRGVYAVDRLYIICYQEMVTIATERSLKFIRSLTQEEMLTHESTGIRDIAQGTSKLIDRSNLMP